MDFKEALNVIPFPELRRELLVALRGRRPQALVAKAMGVSPQQVYRWEAGKRGISWRQLLSFAQACHVSSKEFFALLGYAGDPGDVPALLSFCLKDVASPVAMKVLGCSPFTLSRWKNGRTEPSAEDVLRMIHYFRNQLPDALAKLVPIEKLPSVEPYHLALVRERAFHFRNPVAGAITIALNCEPYLRAEGHEPGAISRLVGIPEEEVERLLEEMAALGIVSRGERGRYGVRASSLVLRGGHWENMNLRAYWSGRAARKFERARDEGEELASTLCGYNVFPLSQAGHKAVRAKFVAFYDELVKTALHAGKSGEGERKIFVFNLQLVDLAETERAYS